MYWQQYKSAEEGAIKRAVKTAKVAARLLVIGPAMLALFARSQSAVSVAVPLDLVLRRCSVNKQSLEVVPPGEGDGGNTSLVELWGDRYGSAIASIQLQCMPSLANM